MLTYKLSNKNLAVRLIKLFTYDAPQSLCAFFWTFLWVLLTLPINLLGLLTFKVAGGFEDEKELASICLFGIITVIFSGLLGVLIGGLYYHTLNTLLLIVVTSVITYIVHLFINNDHEVIKDGFRSVKNKTCPKIEYID
jgi:hypothetical protein